MAESQYDKFIYLNGRWEKINSSVVIDNHLDLSSENPVQNKVIFNALNSKPSINDLSPSSISTYSSSKIESLLGNIGSVLDSINGEVI